MARVRVDLNHRGMRGLLRDEVMRLDMERRAERVAQRAREAHILVEGVPGDVVLPIKVTSGIGRTRAHARVTIAHPSGVAVEAKHGLLTRSLDAAG